LPTFAGPCDELFQEVVDLLYKSKDGFERLYIQKMKREGGWEGGRERERERERGTEQV